MYHTIAAPAPDAPFALDPLAEFPNALWQFDASEVPVRLKARTGQVATFARTSTATGTDANGTTFTVPKSGLAWDWRDWDNDGVRERAGILFGANDVIQFPMVTLGVPAGAFTFMVDIIETGGRTSTNGGVWYFGNDAMSGFYLAIQATGTTYRARRFDGSTTKDSTLSYNPATGDRLRLVGTAVEDGSIILASSRNGAAFTTESQSVTQTPASTLPTDMKVRLGRVPTPTTCAHWFGSGLLVRNRRSTTDMTTRY